MSIIIDLIVIGILALSIFLGYKKGLIGVAFKIISSLIAIVITLILFKPVTNIIINNTTIDETIKNTIVEKLSTADVEENGQISKEGTNLPNIIVDYINEGIKGTIDETRDNLVEVAAENLSKTGIEILVIIALFIVTRILLIFAKTLLEAVAELPLIKQFNEAGGIIYGILRGLIYIYILLAIISLILPIIDKGTILSAINSSILTKILYNNNIILMLFFK